jgi:hypothetical protein
MNFYEKYIKYKKKYLKYKTTFQFGGGKPLNNIIKNINLFTNPDMEQYLNPIYGFFMCETDYIVYNYDLYDKDFIKTNDSKIIHKISKRLPETIKPLPEIMETAKPIDIGRYIALLYICKDNENFIRYGRERKIIFEKINKSKEIYKKSKDRENIILCETDISQLTTFINKNKLIKNNIDFNTKERIDFYILLYCLWWITNNKTGIEEYYVGINEVFDIVNKYLGEKHIKKIIIPSDFKSNIFTIEDILKKPNNDSVELCIFKITERFKIFDQEKSNNLCSPKFTYSDCGETTARNLINLICFNDNKFDIKILKSLGAINELIEYYTTFNNFASQSSTDIITIYNEKLSSRDAWSKLILNYANTDLILRQECPCDKSKRFELNSGLSLNKQTTNFFQLIKNLLPSITIWDDLLINNINKIEEDINYDDGTGEIILYHNIYEKVIINCEPLHYYMKIEQENLNYDYSHICNKIQKNFLNILTNNIEINKHNYLWIKWTPDLFEEEYNKDEEDKNGQLIVPRKELLELSSTYKFDSYLRGRLMINVDSDLKLVDINKLEFNDYRYESFDFKFVREIPKLEYLSHILLNSNQITKIDLSPLSNIISIDTFLMGCIKLKDINLSPLKNVTTILDGFLIGCKSLTSVDLSPLKKITNIGNQFLSNCQRLTSVDLLPLENIKTIGFEFLASCYNLKSIDLSPLKNIITISSGFLTECINLKTIDMSPLKNVKTIDNSFLYGCKKLICINLSLLTKVETIGYEFLGNCTSLESVDISSMENLTEIDENFLSESNEFIKIICTLKQKELLMINNYELINKIVIKT